MATATLAPTKKLTWNLSGLPAGGEVGVSASSRQSVFVAASGVVFTGVVALLDLATGPHLSFAVFYLIPVVGCAWWGGFALGLFVAALASAAGHVIDVAEHDNIPVAIRIWNDIVRFGTLILVGSLVSRLHIGILRERRLARTDPLTGAANARTFYEAAAVEAQRARRTEKPLTLAYFDLDDFKQLNDHHGHAVGDEVLRLLVQSVRANLRATDLLARLGGDEFAVLLPGADAEPAKVLLVRIKDAIAAQMAERQWPVAISIGAVTFVRPPLEVDLMIRRVDALMYRAKHGGKSRIEHAVAHTETDTLGLSWPRIDRRATARVVCNRSARVTPEGEDVPDGAFATLRDISVAGIGLYLDRRLDLDTVIVIEPLSPQVHSLLARVTRVEPEGAGWMHGCVLAHQLDVKDFGGWVDAERGFAADSVRPETLAACATSEFCS